MKLTLFGRMDACVLLWYAIDPERAAVLVPPGLELITARGAAFFNIELRTGPTRAAWVLATRGSSGRRA
jgi:hypothetical protein